jgi:hypothetical protein
MGSDIGAIADYPQAKTRTKFVGMDVNGAVVVIYFIAQNLSSQMSRVFFVI